MTFFNVYPLHNSGKMRGFYTTGIMHLWCALLCKSRFKCQYRVGQVYTPEAVKTENYGCCKLCVLTAFTNEHVARNVPNLVEICSFFLDFYEVKPAIAIALNQSFLFIKTKETKSKFAFSSQSSLMNFFIK